MTEQGRFITFEGIDGAGKSTQIGSLAALAGVRGREVLVTREPGGTPLGEKIRGLLLNDEMGLDAETLLFFAARAEHVKAKIRPALERGMWVLSDRFTDATYAYQVGGKAMSAERVEALERWTLGGFKPDLTVLFDLSPETAARRRARREDEIQAAADRFERESIAFFSRVREAYLARAEREPSRFLIVDAEAAQEAIAEKIRERVSAWL